MALAEAPCDLGDIYNQSYALSVCIYTEAFK